MRHLILGEYCWRLGSLSARTSQSPVIPLVYLLPGSGSILKPRRTFRNPLVVAMELAAEMRRERISQSELARRHGLTRARVNQWLSLLQLPVGERRRILAMGDHWERRVVTERSLRMSDTQSG